MNEVISLTPESMSEFQFEIAATDDGGADIALLENHRDAAKVALSDTVCTVASHTGRWQSNAWLAGGVH